MFPRNAFFSYYEDMIENMGVADIAIRIILAAVLGGAIGLEREIREHTAGFRTHILVAVGAAAFTVASYYGLEGTDFDPNRIAAGIVTGIGFLGAGAIIRYGATVKGLTTAASLWAVAAVGLMAGQGAFVAALITTAVVILSLYGLRKIEDWVIYRRFGMSAGFTVHFRTAGYGPLVELVAVLHDAHIEIKEMAVTPDEDPTTTVHLFLKLPRGLTEARATALIADLNVVESVGKE